MPNQGIPKCPYGVPERLMSRTPSQPGYQTPAHEQYSRGPSYYDPAATPSNVNPEFSIYRTLSEKSSCKILAQCSLFFFLLFLEKCYGTYARCNMFMSGDGVLKSVLLHLRCHHKSFMAQHCILFVYMTSLLIRIPAL